MEGGESGSITILLRGKEGEGRIGKQREGASGEEGLQEGGWLQEEEGAAGKEGLQEAPCRMRGMQEPGGRRLQGGWHNVADCPRAIAEAYCVQLHNSVHFSKMLL